MCPASCCVREFMGELSQQIDERKKSRDSIPASMCAPQGWKTTRGDQALSALRRIRPKPARANPISANEPGSGTRLTGGVVE